MKKINFLSRSLLRFLIVFIAVGASAQDKGMEFDVLPLEAQHFVKFNFGKERIIFIKANKKNIANPEYEVHLVDGTKIVFDPKGNWKAVDGNMHRVATMFIPKSIRQHIHKTSPKTYVTKVEKKNEGYEVKLTNGLQMAYNFNGKFLNMVN